jgi:hypothetical protein
MVHVWSVLSYACGLHVLTDQFLSFLHGRCLASLALLSVACCCNLHLEVEVGLFKGWVPLILLECLCVRCAYSTWRLSGREPLQQVAFLCARVCSTRSRDSQVVLHCRAARCRYSCSVGSGSKQVAILKRLTLQLAGGKV